MIDPDGRNRGAWLDYAWRVVTCAQSESAHFKQCNDLRGAVDERVVGEGRLRWPGVANSRYRPEHGVLFVGSVHREFHIGRNGKKDPVLVEQEEILVRSNQAWRDSGRSTLSDSNYLDSTAGAYETSISRWPRGDVVMSLLAKLGDSVAEAAWVSLARCQVPPTATNESLLRQACQRSDVFLVSEVIDALRPCAMFVAVLGTVDRTTRAGRVRQGDGTVLDGRKWHPLVYVFDGRQRTDRTQRKFDVWSDQASAEIRERRRSRP